MRPSAILKETSEEHKKQKKDGGRHSNAKKNLPKVNGFILDAFRVEWSLISCKFQVCNNFFGFQKNYFQKLE